MTIEMTENSKLHFSIWHLPILERMQREMGTEDDSEPIAYWKSVFRCVTGIDASSDCEVLKAKAEFEINYSVYDRYFDGSNNADILCTYLIYDPWYGFVDCSLFLSDIWEFDGTDETYNRIREQAINRCTIYKEVSNS